MYVNELFNFDSGQMMFQLYPYKVPILMTFNKPLVQASEFLFNVQQLMAGFVAYNLILNMLSNTKKDNSQVMFELKKYHST